MQRVKSSTQLHIRTKAAVVHYHFLVFVFTDFTGKVKQRKSLFNGNGFNALIFFQAGESRFWTAFLLLPNLYIGPEAAQFGQHFFAGFGIGSDFSGRIDLFPLDAGSRFHGFVKGLVKLADHVLPDQFALCNGIKFLFDTGSKVVIYNRFEIRGQKIVDNQTHIGGKQFGFFGTIHFGFHMPCYLTPFQVQFNIFSGFPVTPLFGYIFSLFDGGNRGSIGTGSSDAHLLQFFHQAGFCVAGFRPGKALTGFNLVEFQLFSGFHKGKQFFISAFLFFIGFGIGVFDVHLQKSIEFNYFACSLIMKLFSILQFQICTGIFANGDNGALQFGIGHLRGNGTLPDQFIKSLFVPFAGNRGGRKIGGPDGFVGFLG